MSVTESARRFEVFTGAGQRRRWTPAENAQIVEESFSGIKSVCAVARRHGLASTQLFAWRKEARDRAPETSFVPVLVEAVRPAVVAEPSKKRRRRSRDGGIELEIDGVVLRVSRGARRRRRRPKYACRSCEEGVVQAPAPARLIEGGLPTEVTVAHVAGGQVRRLTCCSTDRRRSTPGRPEAGSLHPGRLIRARRVDAAAAARAADGAADPSRRRSHRLGEAFCRRDDRAGARSRTRPLPETGQLWAYARDDRPWNGPDPPGVAYIYAPDRKAERPIAHLVGFRGVLQVDGYGATARARRRARCGWPSAGATSAAASTSWPPPAPRRSAGSDGGEHWAVLASLVETCKLNDVEPQAYLADALTRLVNGHPSRRLDQLLPWAYVA